jgi:hypothetical protein
MQREDIAEIWKHTRSDPLLQSNLDIAKILDSCSDDSPMSLKEIAQQTFQALRSLSLDTDTIQDYCQRLVEYRVIDSIDQLSCGKYIRWIRSIPEEDSEKNPITLSIGGILSDIKFLENGVFLSALAPGTRFPRKIKYDNYLIFQKMTEQEMLFFSMV